MTIQYHHGDLKTALLTYAQTQLENASLDRLSMREMAQAIGVSHTAAYRHFKDKHALLEAVAVQGFEEMLVANHVAVDAASPNPRAQLKACGLAYVHFGLTHPRRLAHMFNAVSRTQATGELTNAAAQLFEFLLQLVSTGQNAGIFRSGDARQLSHACWAMVHGLSTLSVVGLLQGLEADLDALRLNAEQALEVFLDGMTLI
jgi:AcrR family transcriptional regulator